MNDVYEVIHHEMISIFLDSCSYCTGLLSLYQYNILDGSLEGQILVCGSISCLLERRPTFPRHKPIISILQVKCACLIADHHFETTTTITTITNEEEKIMQLTFVLDFVIRLTEEMIQLHFIPTCYCSYQEVTGLKNVVTDARQERHS